MINGKTSSGFAYKISDEAANNFELLEVMAEVEDNPLRLPRVVQLLLGDDQKKKLFDHVRTKNGTVPIDLVTKEVLEIFSNDQKAKNS